jgi:hypothetical protein
MIAQLLSQARSAGVKVYLIGKPGVSVAKLRRLARAVPSAEGAMVALDPGDALKSIWRPTGPTIVLVDAHGRTVEPPLSPPPLHLEHALRHLGQAH